MIVCQCLGITDREIRQAAQSGARTSGDIGFRCSAGTLCGGCRETINELLGADSAAKDDEPRPSAVKSSV